ncbi:MAG: hypothetical protein HQK53_09075 [Oligoflexia bacterium]|nr:hypothetical protein [Oligoflexia bacterium]
MICYEKLFNIKCIKFIVITFFYIQTAYAYYPYYGTEIAIPYLVLTSAVIPFLGIIPGFILRSELERYLIDNKVQYFHVLDLCKYTAIIFFAGTLKSVLAAGWNNTMSWGFLHFVGLSYILLVLLSFISIYVLTAVSILILFVTPWAFAYFAQWINLVDVQTMPLLMKDPCNWLLPLVVEVSILLGMMRWVLKKKFTSRKKTMIIIPFVSIAFAIGLFFFYKLSNDNFFAYQVFLFTKSAFFKLSEHNSWPIFPWFFLVFFGFIWLHLYTITTSKKAFNFLTIIFVCFVAIILWKFYSFDSWQHAANISVNGYRRFQQFLFSISGPLDTLMICALFSLLFMLVNLLSPLIRKNTFLCEIIDVYNSGIFVVYIFMTVIIDPLITLSLKIDIVNKSLTLIVATYLLICYFVSKIVLVLSNIRVGLGWSSPSGQYIPISNPASTPNQ